MKKQHISLALFLALISSSSYLFSGRPLAESKDLERALSAFHAGKISEFTDSVYVLMSTDEFGILLKTLQKHTKKNSSLPMSKNQKVMINLLNQSVGN